MNKNQGSPKKSVDALKSFLADFNKLESLFKAAGLMTLGLDSNVLNEYRYFARAIMDMVKHMDDINTQQFDQARGRAETASSAALCDTVDNVYYYIRKSTLKIANKFPAFNTLEYLTSVDQPKAFEYLNWLEVEITQSREDRSKRKDIYQKIAGHDNFKQLIKLAREMPKINAAAPGSHVPDSWLKKILDGLANSEFELFFQPKRLVRSGEVIGAEVLLRWFKANGSVSIPPMVFIKAAEKCGAIHMLGDFVIKKACETLFKWSHQPILQDLILSINVSPIQLEDLDFSEKLMAQIKLSKVKHKKLELEITEDVLIKEKKLAARHLNSLDNCLISVDDFGKGSTEFTYLAEFQFDYIKVDRSLLTDALDYVPKKFRSDDSAHDKDCNDESSYEKLIKGIVALSEGVGARVVVEGVQDKRGLNLMEKLNVDIYQGYYDGGKPMALESFEDFARENRINLQ